VAGPADSGKPRKTPRSIAIALGQGTGRRASARWPDWPGAISRLLHRAIQTEVDRRRPFLWLPVCFGLGIVAYFAAETEPSLPMASGLCLAALLVAGFGRASLRVMGPALALAALFGGMTAGILRARLVAAPVLAAPAFVTVDGRIEIVDRTVYGARIVVVVQDMDPAVERMPERIRVTLRGRHELESGAGLRFKARLTPPGPASVPGGFDFEREAYFQRLGAVGFVTGAITPKPDLAPAPLLSRLIAGIDRGRNALTERIIAVVGGSTGAIAAALITGKRGQIAEQDNENWRAAGIYHIVSISGLHMVLAAGLFFWIARLLLALFPGFSTRHPTKKWAAAIAMAGAVAYDVFSGSEVATERSLIMTLVMLGAILVDRPALAMRNLAISGLLIMALRPETVLGPSFQMSFGAVSGLVAYGEYRRYRQDRLSPAEAEKHTHWSWRVGHFLVGFLLTSVIAGLATAPFQAYHFHRLNPYGMLGNLLAIPLCSFVVMPSALIGVVLYPLGLDAPIWWIMGRGVAGIQEFAIWVAALSGSVATVLRFGSGALAIMALGLLILTLMTTPVFRLGGVAVLAGGILLAGQAQRPDLILDATGTTALVRGPDGRMTLLGKTRSTFALQQWLPGDRDARAPRDPTLTAAARCDAMGCTTRAQGGHFVALVIDPAAFAEDCERAQVIITALRAPKACSTTTRIYDREHFAAYGATYVYDNPDAPHLETARNPRQQRPWTRRTSNAQSPLTPVSGSTPAQADLTPQPWDPQAQDPAGEPQ